MEESILIRCKYNSVNILINKNIDLCSFAHMNRYDFEFLFKSINNLMNPIMNA